MGVPYWLDGSGPDLPTRRFDGRADVEIVGGGVTGCACALVLAQAGLRVRLHEAREIAGGASGRNGGFALRGTAAPYPVAVETIGGDATRSLWQATEDALDLMGDLAGDSFRRTGSLRIANDGDEEIELREEYDALTGAGFGAEWIDGADLRPAGRFVAAILHPPDGVLHPAQWVRRLAAHAGEAGADIRERSHVASLSELRADHVVVATDGYPSGLLGDFEGAIVPTRGQMLATEPLAELVWERPHYARHGFDYWHQTPDGRLLAGGFRDVSLLTELTTDEVTTPAIQRALESFVTGLVGRPVAITHGWAGLFGLVPDFLPVVGLVPGLDAVSIAGGYTGHGNVLGLLCGRLVADALLGRPVAPEISLFDPARLA